ncbi:hypothetical protein GCM10010123_32000 [Pilimelia anulata]|uniref:Uncharacterized protein n=1 Tax=Pilimelia anulata TaxID=53371 RepID=A0A8J3B6P8_9ACTN|nr:hypothetical protein GCM10010123_32000 [Pilimelia anulata]
MPIRARSTDSMCDMTETQDAGAPSGRPVGDVRVNVRWMGPGRWISAVALGNGPSGGWLRVDVCKLQIRALLLFKCLVAGPAGKLTVGKPTVWCD